MLVAAGGLDQMPAGREREVIAGHQHAVGGGAVEQLLARRHGGVAVDVEGRLPVGMTCEHRGMLRGVAEHHERLVARMNGEHGVAGRVAGRRQRDDAGRNLGSRLEARDLLRNVGKDAALIAEGEPEVGRRRIHVGVVHPERPFRRGHHDLGVGEDEAVVLVLDAVDVVRVEMRDDDEVDRLRIDAGGGEIVAEHAGRRRDLAAGAGVDKHELAAGVDDQGREWRRQLVGGHERGGERALHFGERRVVDEFLRDRAVPDAVIERGQLEGADPVAVDAGRLLAGGRLRGSGRIGARGKGRGSGRAGEEVAARQCRHGVSVFSKLFVGDGAGVGKNAFSVEPVNPANTLIL